MTSGELRRTGRAGSTPKGGTTRAVILEAAARVFDRRGYHATSLRDIAVAADVDLALLSYYFGSKRGLFFAAIAPAMEAVAKVPEIVERSGPNAGADLADLLVSLLENGGTPLGLTALLRTVLTPSSLADPVRDEVVAAWRYYITRVLDSSPNPQQAALMVAEIIGIVGGRYISRHEPVTSLPITLIRDRIAVRIQSIIEGVPAAEVMHNA